MLLTARISLSQENIVIPLGKPLEVEVPVEYTFKAGTENINKTVYVKFRIDDLKVVHKPLKQFVGESMGLMDDELNVTHWFSYSSPTGVTVDGQFIPFSEFILKSNDYGPFNLRDAHFTWTQGNSHYN